MKKIFSIFTLFFLSGCTHLYWFNGDRLVVFDKPKIHLFLYNDYKARAKELMKVLVDGGYEVVLRNRKPPTEGGGSFIIHSPGINPNHFDEVDAIIDILNDQGVKDIDKYQYTLVNHSYTAKNIGVYLQ